MTTRERVSVAVVSQTSSRRMFEIGRKWQAEAEKAADMLTKANCLAQAVRLQAIAAVFSKRARLAMGIEHENRDL